MNEKILLVEDEPGLRITLSDRLHSEGYQVETAADGEEGLERAAGGSFDLIVLDLILPARGQTVDKVLGLKLGADDYLTKPFEMPELLARIEALLRRARQAPAQPGSTHRFGSIQVDLRGTEVLRDGKQVPLSAKEFQLLRYFIEHPGKTLS